MGKNMKNSGKSARANERKTSIILWLFGYHYIDVPRSLLEDFLNLCLRYGFNYYSIFIDEDARSVTLKVSSIELRNILTACRMWQIRVKVRSAHGMPIALSHFKGRWGLLVGAAMALCIFLLSQGVIWKIDVVGNHRLTGEEIARSLDEYGLSVGKRISRLNTDSIEQRVMINNDDIAWLSINISGTVARVEVLEVIDTELRDENKRSANLISNFDAQIVSVEAYTGFVAVKEGDFVRSGDLLVSGIHKEGKAPLRFSRASGTVLGKVVYTLEIEIPLVQEKKVTTGEKISKKTLIFFGKPIKFFSNYRNLPISYDIINYVYTFNPFSLGELPISLFVEEIYPYTSCEVEISEDEAMEQAYEVLRERIDAELPGAQILKKSLYGETFDGRYILKCTITAICNIARQVEFDVVN